jgi:MerR family transcriptional regulator/heat shock protein HspR
VRDLERVRQIRRLTDDMGVNLAGVEVIMRLTDHIRDLESRLADMEAELARVRGSATTRKGERR